MPCISNCSFRFKLESARSNEYGSSYCCIKHTPVEELISDGKNGLLVDFFSSSDLAHAISEILTHTTLSDDLAKNAKQLIIDKYQISHCVPLHLNLQAVASGVLSH